MSLKASDNLDDCASSTCCTKTHFLVKRVYLSNLQKMMNRSGEKYFTTFTILVGALPLPPRMAFRGSTGTFLTICGMQVQSKLILIFFILRFHTLSIR